MSKLIDWESHTPTILTLVEEGLSTNAISKEIGVSRVTLVKYMENTLGISTKRNGPRPKIDWVDSDNIRCSICSEIKHSSEYYVNKSDCTYTFCKKCYSEKERVRRLSKPVSWVKKSYDISTSAKKRGFDFNLTPDYLSFVYTAQEGLCAYTNEKINLSLGRGLSGDCLSVDRFDTSLGYLKGNIVLSTTRANTIKHNQTLEEFRLWMPDWEKSGRETLERVNTLWSSHN